MADFVAVIRKAVDGLANNTPENRAKVYDKARSAVVRQLENMKPRPPEELLRRQIAKLDAAITEVDSEYAEALPPLEEDDAFSPAVEEVAAPYDQQDIAEERTAHIAEQHEPVEEEPAPVAPAQPEPVYEEPAPVAAVTPHEEQRYGEREPEELYDAPEPVRAVASREEAGTYFTREHEEPAHQPEDERVGDVEPETALTHADDSVPSHWAQPVDEDDWRKLDEARDEDVRPAAEEYAEVRNEADERPVVAGYAAQHYQAPDVSFEPERREEDDHAGHRASVDHDPIFGGHGDFSEPRQTEDTAPKKAAVVEDFSSYFEDTDLAIPAKDAPALPRADNDPFDDRAAAKDNKERTPWDDLDELIGYDGASSSSRATTNETPALGAGAATPAYMVKKKPRRNYASVVLALVGAGLLAGGGYALWQNRDALNDMVGGLVQSAQKGGNTQTPPANTAQTSTPPAAQQPPATGQQPTTNPTNHQAQPHSDDGSVTGTKFTQRLLADGTERDEGPAAGANGQPVTAEGQSVYEQNVAAPPAGEAPANNAGAPAGTPTGTPAGTPPTAQPPAAAAAAGDRMFLYEEVLGQTVPTAIQGSVSWSLQQEKDSEGRSSPTVQGQITVPGRGLSALITFKRNTDPSLPASHLIEIVFSVSPGFEGGAIDSVQRIAMKSTEQDRGNALIAVPAKITDDFHMIALNDFPDAMKTNLELLKSRNWIDIPVSYRNGRRALLTLQKGNDGIAAFDTALREWAAAKPATGQ
jgi:hypothetical protein